MAEPNPNKTYAKAEKTAGEFDIRGFTSMAICAHPFIGRLLRVAINPARDRGVQKIVVATDIKAVLT